MGQAVNGLAVCVSPQLTEIREPAVGALDGPAQPHGLLLGRAGVASFALLGDHGVVDVVLEEPLACELGVVAPVQPDRLDVAEQSACRGVGEGGLEKDRVIAVGPVADPADGNALGVGEDGPCLLYTSRCV